MLSRLDHLLTFRRACTYAAVLVALFAAAWVYELVLGSPPLNAAGAPIGGDYIAFHTAGRLVLSGQGALLYDHAAVSAAQDRLLGGRIPGFYDAFRNPPFFALAFVPLALLDLLPGFVVWTALSLVCLLVALWLLLQEVPWLKPRWRGLLVLVFAFAPVYFGIIDGENATISLLLYVVIYRALVRHEEGLAGVWAALGLFKPQLFFVFPLVFLAARRWRSLSTYLAVAAGLVVVSVAVVGLEGLAAWARILVEHESSNALANAWRMASLKSLFDLLLPGQSPLALLLYIVPAVMLLTAVVRAWTSGRAPLQARWAFTCLVAVLVDPHLVDYDLSVLVAAGILGTAVVPASRWLVVLLYLVAPLRPALPVGVGVLLIVPSVLSLHTYLTWRLAEAGPLGRQWLPLRLSRTASS